MIDFSIFKSWRVWLTITVSLIVVLGITLFLTGLNGFPAAFPSALVAWGTLMLAIATIMIVTSSRTQENQRRADGLAKEVRDRKERLLNEIIDWVTDINKTSLVVDIPLTNETDIVLATRNVEANTMRRYGIPFTKNGYMIAIATNVFKEDLQDSIRDFVDIFTSFLFFKGTSFGMENIKQAFGGTALKTIEAIEKELKDNKMTIQQGLDEYVEKLAFSANRILIKTTEIKARLLTPETRL